MLNNIKLSQLMIPMYGLLVVLLCGCSSVGSPVLANMDSATLPRVIHKGKTDSQTVLQNMGQPSDIKFSDMGDEIWTYDYKRIVPRTTNFIPYLNLLSSVSDVNHKKLVILFDENSIVKNFSMSNSHEETRSGLFE